MSTKKKLSRRDFLRWSAAAAGGLVAASCGAAPTPIVIEKEVPVEKEVVKTVVVEKEVAVEKVVTATPAPVEIAEIRLAEGSWVGPEGIAFWTDDIIHRFEAGKHLRPLLLRTERPALALVHPDAAVAVKPDNQHVAQAAGKIEQL